MGNIELAERILTRFEDSVSSDIDELIASLEARTHSETRRIAHRIKGCCANVGAEDLVNVATELELLAESDRIEQPSEWIDRIRHEQGRVTAEKILPLQETANDR